MVIHGKLISEVFRQGVRLAGRYYKIEGKAFEKLYTGFPQSRTIGRGVRHGLVAGQIAGSFINQAPDTPGNGIPSSRFKSPTGQPYKTRGRFSVRSRGRYSGKYCVNRKRRRSGFSKRRRM